MGDEGDIVLVIDRSPLRKPYQHRTSRSDLAGSDQKAQVAGAGDEDSAQYRALLEDRGEDDHALIVDGRKTEAVEAAAARAPDRHPPPACATRRRCKDKAPAAFRDLAGPFRQKRFRPDC